MDFLDDQRSIIFDDDAIIFKRSRLKNDSIRIIWHTTVPGKPSTRMNFIPVTTPSMYPNANSTLAVMNNLVI